jgi:hypothetical protein
MRHLKWLIVFAFIGLSFVRLQAQPATQEQIDRARDLLRSPQLNPPITAAPSAVRTNAPLANFSPASAPAALPSGGIGTLTPDMEQQAREILQNMRSKSRPAAFPAGNRQPPAAKTEAEIREAARQQALMEAQRAAEEKRNAGNRNLPVTEKNALEETARQKRIAQIEAAVAQAKKDNEAKAASAVTPSPAPAPETPVVAPAPPAAPVTISQPTPNAPPAAPVATPVLTPELEQKARELLNQKLAEVPPTAPLTVAPPVAPVEPPAAAPASVIAPPVVAAPAAAVQPAGIQAPATSEKEAKARALLEQKLAELHSLAPATAPPSTPAIPAAQVTLPPSTPVPPVTTVPPAVSVAPVVTAPATTPPFGGGTLTPEAEIQARDLLRQQWNERQTVTPPADEKRAKAEAKARQEADARAKRDIEKLDAEAKAKTRAEARRKSESEARTIADSRARGQRPDKRATMQPGTPGANISGELPPPIGLSDSKQQRLTELLNAYMQDRISPAEYHEKRAKILAEP